MEYRIPYKDSKIQYYLYGHGPIPLLCLHGYGEDGSSFAILEPAFGDRFTFIAIDLPLHGRTEWQLGLFFTPQELWAVYETILPLHAFDTSNLCLLGFSMGGRIALALCEQFPQHIKSVYLAAPDGLKMDPWYRFATSPFIGNWIFLFTIRHPRWFLGLIKVAVALRLMHRGKATFVRSYLGTETLRMALYERWMMLRKFVTHPNRIGSLLTKYGTQIKILLGKNDRAIPPALGEDFRKGKEASVSITVIDAGHRLLQEKHLPEWRHLLDG